MARAREAEERELIARCRAGEEEGWRGLVERYQRMVYAIARRVAGPAAAADAAQETFLRVFRKLDTYRAEAGGKFSSWLYRVAYTVSCDIVRKRGPVGQWPENFEGVYDGAGPAELTAQAEEVRLARAALAAIRPAYRNALELYYLFGNSYEEVAEIMALPLGTVKSHVHRGKKAILSALREMGAAESVSGRV